MSIQTRISAIYDLGQFFLFITENEFNKNANSAKFEYLRDEFLNKLKLAEIQNPWFTPDNLQFCLEQWGKILTPENLQNWTERYPEINYPKNIGIIMAGNIPLVGFHDLISVLVSGHDAIVKTSSKDDVLMSFVIEFLKEADENLKNSIHKVEKLKDHDAVIATGSNNTARYFEYYFKDLPHIIRKNRTSVAVLNGDETEEDLKNLSEDVFRYFGLGCRNVTKLYLPSRFNTDLLFESFYHWNPIIHHTKYSNNYDYNRAIFLMSKDKFLDNNFVILKESSDLFSPIGVLNYEFYDDINKVREDLNSYEEKIQCIVGNNFSLEFGQTQKPMLTDYADGVDTLEFLTSL